MRNPERRIKSALQSKPKPRTLVEVSKRSGLPYWKVKLIKRRGSVQPECLWPVRAIEVAEVLSRARGAVQEVGPDCTRVDMLMRAEITRKGHLKAWATSEEYRELLSTLKRDKPKAYTLWKTLCAANPETLAKRMQRAHLWRELEKKHAEAVSQEHDEAARRFREKLAAGHGQSVVGRVFARAELRSSIEGANKRGRARQVKAMVREYADRR